MQRSSAAHVHATEQDLPIQLPQLVIAMVLELIMSTLATAMRAGHVADFYMTKYASKAQEVLGSTMQQFIACMRRIDVTENEPDDVQLLEELQKAQGALHLDAILARQKDANKRFYHDMNDSEQKMLEDFETGEPRKRSRAS